MNCDYVIFEAFKFILIVETYPHSCSLAPMYYRGAQAAIVVYDITNADTFTRAKSWVGELHRQARPDIVIALGMLRFLHLPGCFSSTSFVCKFIDN